MVLLIKEYNIPFIGEISLLDSNGGYGESITGIYYAENGREVAICKKCSSVKELIGKTGNKVKDYFEKQIALSEHRINTEKDKKEKLELILEEMKDLKSPKEVEAWLKKYQTDNPLQLEYQETEKQKGDKK